ncbi:MAG: serine/threonine-protein kinase [Myxococcota bacterium]
MSEILDLQSDELEPGLEMGGYRVLEWIGEGGLGRVYLATHRQTRKLVALKILRARCTRDPYNRARFQREGEIALELRHENLVGGLQRGEEKGQSYVAFEYVEGTTLDHRLEQSGPISPSKSPSLFLQMAAAVSAFQEHGFVHRDVKCANFLVTRADTVKLFDYSLAHHPWKPPLIDPRPDRIAGTPRAMSLEQWEGAPPCPSDDVFGLGVAWYHLITGSYPYEGEAPSQLILALSRDERIRLADRPESAHVPNHFVELVDRMTAPAKSNRPGDAVEILAALGAG